MERYINPSKITFKEPHLVGVDGELYITLSDMKKAIEETPSEDVVQKSEVVKIFEEIEKASVEWKGYVSSDVRKTLAELKKKYTE